MPAAGSGRRFGGDTPKQYLFLGQARVIERALAPFIADARCRGICVALDASDEIFSTLPLAGDPRVPTVAGGARRCDSVRNALAALPATESEWVLVHDAARPCLARADIDRLLVEAGQDAVGGLLAVPLADTLKRAQADVSPAAKAARVVDTPPRTGLWRALTPQMFRAGLLRDALRAAVEAGREPTDEAQAIEWVGHAPQLVSGDPVNLKITTPADLRLSAAWLAGQNQA
jgi:2-C-methyl-D-erythritol 4-phosphate cytidylyltransferase